MREVQLLRSAEDRRRYEIDGVGWLRSASWLSGRGESGAADATSAEWAFEPRGWAGGRAEALDLRSGMPIGGYRRTATFTHRGEVTWAGRLHTLRTTSSWRQRFELDRDGVAVVALQVRGYGRAPVTLSVAPDVEPGLVLFTCWLCRLFVTQDSAAT